MISAPGKSFSDNGRSPHASVCREQFLASRSSIVLTVSLPYEYDTLRIFLHEEG